VSTLKSRLERLERGRKEPDEISLLWPMDNSPDPLLRNSRTGEEMRQSEITANGERVINLRWPEDEK
jgi:hypothetical protein